MLPRTCFQRAEAAARVPRTAPIGTPAPPRRTSLLDSTSNGHMSPDAVLETRAAIRDEGIPLLQNPNVVCGGERAGRASGASQSRPRWIRMRRATERSVIIAMSLRRLPQCSQRRTSIENTRRMSSAQSYRLEGEGGGGAGGVLTSRGFEGARAECVAVAETQTATALLAGTIASRHDDAGASTP